MISVSDTLGMRRMPQLGIAANRLLRGFIRLVAVPISMALLGHIVPAHVLAETHGRTPAYSPDRAAESLRVYALADPTIERSLEDVCCSLDADSWRLLPEAKLRAAPWRGSLWFKLEGIQAPVIVTLSAIVDRAELYWRGGPGGAWQQSLGGDHVPVGQRTLDAASVGLPISTSGSIDAAYLHVEQGSLLSIAISTMPFAGFQASETRHGLIKLYLFGFVTAIAAYNLIVAGLLRDSVFLLNALTMLSLLLFALHLSGHLGWVLWPDQPSTAEHAMNVALAAATVFGLLFIYSFVSAPRHASPAPDAWRADPLLWPIPAVLLAMVTTVWLSYAWVRLLLLVLAAITVVLILVTLLFRAWAGQRNARILLLPFFVGLFPGITLAWLSRLEGWQFAGLLKNGFEFFIAVEAMLFSLVIALRVRMAEAARATALEDLRAEREQVAGRIIEAQDSERRRVAQDIHDSVGQRLLFLINSLRVASKTAGEKQDDWQHAAGQATQALDGLRRISRHMHPSSLDHLGWIGSVQALIDAMNANGQTECRVSFDVDEALLLREQKLHLYRIVQEVLSNVVRHAHATECRARFWTTTDTFHMQISDDGDGYLQTSGGCHDTGLGLTSIRERCRLMGGNIRLDMPPGGGTRVTLTVPLHRVESS